ncbi:MAG TPA: DCC1-like thiol-disulfide oxidoreductase family protein [Nitrososphaeraceae archaeon]
MANYVLAYDVDCGPCTRFKQMVDLLDAYHQINFISLYEADKIGLLNKIPHTIRFTSFHLICPDGKILSGADGLTRLVAILPLGTPVSKLISKTPGGKYITRFLYNTFSKLHNSPACGTKQRF